MSALGPGDGEDLRALAEEPDPAPAAERAEGLGIDRMLAERAEGLGVDVESILDRVAAGVLGAAGAEAELRRAGRAGRRLVALAAAGTIGRSAMLGRARGIGLAPMLIEAAALEQRQRVLGPRARAPRALPPTLRAAIGEARRQAPRQGRATLAGRALGVIARCRRPCARRRRAPARRSARNGGGGSEGSASGDGGPGARQRARAAGWAA